MGKKKIKGEPLESAQPSDAEAAASSPNSESSSAAASPAIQTLHSTSGGIFKLLVMREEMLEQRRDTNLIDQLIAQETAAFQSAMWDIIDGKLTGVVVIPTKEEARRKTKVDLLETVRELLETAGPAPEGDV